MQMNKYQEFTRKTAIYAECDLNNDFIANISYLGLGLNGESGEVAETVKKWLRGDYGNETLQDRLKGELGDCLWYLARLADEIGLSLSDVAKANKKKLTERLQKGTLRGDGEDR